MGRGGFLINTITHGDAKEVSRSIPDESVGLVFCDPVYQNMDDYAWLAEESARVLKPGRALLAFCSSQKMKQTQEAMDPFMKFNLPLFYVVKAKVAYLNAYKALPWTTPIVVYSKGKIEPRAWYVDTFISTARPSGTHKWNKNLAVLRYYVDRFSQPGDIVWDPFTGHGSIPMACIRAGRQFIASEIDKDKVEVARNLVGTTMEDLF